MNTFNRMTIMAAARLLTRVHETHTSMDALLAEYNLDDDIISGTLDAKANALAKRSLVAPETTVFTLNGEVGLQEALINEALKAVPKYREGEDWRKIEVGLHRDGFTIFEHEESGSERWNTTTETMLRIRRLYPDDIPNLDFPTAESEVLGLLNKFEFGLVASHLENSINQHSAGKWPEANGEIRKAYESFFDEIAAKLCPTLPANKSSNAKREALLECKPPFLLEKLNELTKGGNKPTYIQGLMNFLHPEGGHAGLSSDEQATFRIHIVLITFRLYLKRFEQYVSMHQNSV